MHRRVLFLLVAAIAVVLPSYGATFIVPPDEWLIDDSPVIVSGTVVDAHARFAEEQNIETVFRIAVDDVLKGTLPDAQIELVEWGGRIGDRWMVAVGAPHYELGKRYVIFLYPNRHGEWTTQNLTLGRFAFVSSPDGELLVRDGAEVRGWDIYGNTAEEPVRRAADFIDFIRNRAKGIRSRLDYAATGTLASAPQQRNVRTADFAGYDFADACNVAVSTWNDDNSSTVNLSISGSPASSDTKSPGDGQDRIIEEDPHGDIAGSFTGSGTVAVAFLAGSGTHTSGGKTYITISGADIVTQDGFRANGSSQSVFRTAMAHEVGHTLGFRHSNRSADDKSSCAAPLPCASGTSAAVMNSVVGALNGNLQGWDRDAVAAAYGNGGDASEYTSKFCADSGCTTFTDETGRRDGASGSFRLAEKAVICTPPSITTQPANKTIVAGDSVQLQVTAAGTGISYQWYTGTSGDTSSPTGTSSNKLTVNPTVTTTYWVRVTGECGTPADSNTVTVTVVPCPEVTITADPSATKNTNGTYTLGVTASSSGQSLSYAWFRGTTPGVGGTQIASTRNPTVSISATTSFWVRITNSCGNSVVSGLVTIALCNLPAITTQPADQTITSGSSATLSLGVSGSVTSISWYQGSVGNKLILAGSGSSISVGPLTQTTQYWAAVANACGEVASRAVVVTVEAASCPLPVITLEPADQTIAMGGVATLTAGVEAATSVTWYQGAAGDKSILVGTGASIAVGPLAATTQFWAAAANSCGETPTRTVTITVEVAQCVAPQITTGPQSQNVKAGQSATLSVVATGTETLHYQWFAGVVPVGTDSAAYTTDPLFETTEYSVQVSNACGSDVSATAVVTVPRGRSRAVRH